MKLLLLVLVAMVVAVATIGSSQMFAPHSVEIPNLAASEVAAPAGIAELEASTLIDSQVGHADDKPTFISGISLASANSAYDTGLSVLLATLTAFTLAVSLGIGALRNHADPTLGSQAEIRRSTIRHRLAAARLAT